MQVAGDEVVDLVVGQISLFLAGLNQLLDVIFVLIFDSQAVFLPRNVFGSDPCSDEDRVRGRPFKALSLSARCGPGQVYARPSKTYRISRAHQNPRGRGCHERLFEGWECSCHNPPPIGRAWERIRFEISLDCGGIQIQLAPTVLRSRSTDSFSAVRVAKSPQSPLRSASEMAERRARWRASRNWTRRFSRANSASCSVTGSVSSSRIWARRALSRPSGAASIGWTAPRLRRISSKE